MEVGQGILLFFNFFFIDTNIILLTSGNYIVIKTQAIIKVKWLLLTVYQHQKVV